MLPIIIGGVAAVTAIGAGLYARANYKKRSTISLGTFAIWGRPNSGKTTFVYQLQQKELPKEKRTTSEMTRFKDIKPLIYEDMSFKIEEITDFPGTNDRKTSWKKLVQEKQHIFYLINLSKLEDKDYIQKVKNDLKLTVEAISNPEISSIKPVNIICTHLDKSSFKDINPSEVNNKIQDSSDFKIIFEKLESLGEELVNSEGIVGHVYSANLIDKQSFRNMLKSISYDICG
ncbi:hypothetical protein CWC02_06100 [Pseudoalteromonas sp. S2721]|uniref:ADP-ribosylation factor-like protein n=1 Tax=Pseudoalteromonas sp. S2721 TaxID=579526 RepID=UPI00110AA4B4|nr:ADP-ribosylation factor-like protein [Pseudoalteromonas sp. S2721]TMP20416.1 hypothetical protein CWC02_06100 [Pseudoalteromonas sp. S2721]